MSKEVSQELIKQAFERGIRPGAKVTHSVAKEFANDPSWIVGPVDKWELRNETMIADSGGKGHSFKWILKYGEWATVLSPAPEEEGLREGDYFIGTNGQIRAVVDFMKRTNLLNEEAWTDEIDEDDCPVSWMPQYAECSLQVCRTNRKMTFSEWWAAMEITAKQEASKPKPIYIHENNESGAGTKREVEFRDGHIKIGCTKVSDEILTAIYERQINKAKP